MLEAGICARRRACCFFCVFSIVLLSRNEPYDLGQLSRNVPSRGVDVRRSCFPRNFVFHTVVVPVASLTVLDHLIGIRLEALENCYVVVLWVYPQELVDNDSHEHP